MSSKMNFDVKDTGWLDGNFKSKSCRFRFILSHWMVKESNTHPLHKVTSPSTNCPVTLVLPGLSQIDPRYTDHVT